MKRLLPLLFLFSVFAQYAKAQTPLTVAPNFNVKTIDGTVVELYPLLDQGKIVVLDFFSVSCGPCQLYAPHFQGAFEAFGRNLGNVFFMGINYNGTNPDVIFFDSVYNLTFPTASGLDGGGNAAFHLFQLSAYPTVIVIKPDKSISNPYIWPPTTDNIIDAVILAGGALVGLDPRQKDDELSIFPNPVNGQSAIRFSLKQATAVSIDLLDIGGRKIDQLLPEKRLEAGNHSLNISSSTLPNGIFFVAFTTEKERILKKIFVVNN
jgi:thiol-disulfide isomerase/thioredoxin